jgi:hypothetical protein
LATNVVGDTENAVAKVDVRNSLAESIHSSGNIEPNSSGRRHGQEALADGPIRRVECASVDSHTDLTGARVRDSNSLQTQHLEWLAIGLQMKCFHFGWFGIVHRVLRLISAIKSRCGSVRIGGHTRPALS